MCLPVCTEITIVCETSITQIALKWFFAGLIEKTNKFLFFGFKSYKSYYEFVNALLIANFD